VLLYLLCWPALAETVYQHIDAQGNVTFSSNPTPEGPGDRVMPVEVEPQVTPEQQEAAQRRADERHRAVERLGQEREAEQTAREEGIEAAERELRDAREALESAQEKTVDDWQYLATGGRVLKQSYLDRVEAAEERVRTAEDTLRRARGRRP
jgi:hypothetical protein